MSGFDPREHTHDSAGQPWAGRTFSPTAFGDDDGAAPPELLAALERHRDEAGSALDVLQALRAARLLVPLVTRLGEAGENEHGVAVDKTQELSIVTVAGPDSRTVLPAFTSVAAMTAWRPEARPIPTEAVRVALAAAGEGTELVVLDPGSDTEFALRRSAIRALAESSEWLPSHSDPAVRDAVARAAEREPAVAGFSLQDGDPTHRLRGPELLIELTILPGLGREQLDAVVAALTARLAAEEVVTARVDSLGLRLRPA